MHRRIAELVSLRAGELWALRTDELDKYYELSTCAFKTGWEIATDVLPS